MVYLTFLWNQLNIFLHFLFFLVISQTTHIVKTTIMETFNFFYSSYFYNWNIFKNFRFFFFQIFRCFNLNSGSTILGTNDIPLSYYALIPEQNLKKQLAKVALILKTRQKLSNGNGKQNWIFDLNIIQFDERCSKIRWHEDLICSIRISALECPIYCYYASTIMISIIHITYFTLLFLNLWSISWHILGNSKDPRFIPHDFFIHKNSSWSTNNRWYIKSQENNYSTIIKIDLQRLFVSQSG